MAMPRDDAPPWVGGWYRRASHRNSPNFGSRPEGVAVDLIVVHSISLPPGEFGNGAIDALFTNRLDWDAHPYFSSIRQIEVSAHFVLPRDGSVVQYVDIHDRAWHAGQSSHGGRMGCNDFSVGVELEGLEGGDFTEAQYAALARLSADLSVALPIEHIAGHEHVSPGRKRDPGSGFDWRHLRKRLAKLTGGASEAWTWCAADASRSIPPARTFPS